jgi:methylated-DNA-protein-cysteine methyltransferase related protein
MPLKKSSSLSSKKELPSKKVQSKNRNTESSKTHPAKPKTEKINSSSSLTEHKLKRVQPSGKREASFFELVYEVARQIPYGRVTSYGAIAACLGTKLSARMVGWAMNGADKVNPTVPAHRVVNRVGLLSGKHHFKPPGKMERLLKKEGIRVKEDVIVNFREKFWDPNTESH